ncbi:MAG TPA: protein kinase [Myxococcales bacterium]|nr:protein kinase [Myxococcales bacterium]
MHKPSKFGKYQLLERIAVGGMAEVFAAKAYGVEGFERLLAIKKILPTMGEDSEFISMFVDEARIAVQLSHANIVQVLELGKHEENLYIAMEYISGRDLRQLLERFRKRQQPMPVPQACLIVAEVCEALDYAHRKRDAQGRPLGIVHRDVSPQNVLVSFEGEVKLIDFGIAKAESRLQKTQAGILKGKFSYMSPEQVKGQPIDGRSDVFACGILLWELICGEKLFTGDSDFAVLERVRNGVIAPLRNAPPELERIVMKALANEPNERYQTASELHDELMRFTLVGGMVYGHRQLAEWLREEFKADFEKEQSRLRGWLETEREEISEVTPSDPHRRRPPPAIVPSVSLGPTPQDPFPGPALLNAIEAASSEPTQQFRVIIDKDTLVAPPTPPKGVTPLPQKVPEQPQARPPPLPQDELPTMKMDESALVEAEKALAARLATGTLFSDEERTTEDARPSTPEPAPAPPVSVLPPPVVASLFDNSKESTGAPRAMRSSPFVKPVRSLEQPRPAAAKPRRWGLWIGVPLALAVATSVWFLVSAPDEARPGKVIITPSPSVTADLLIDGKPAGQLPPFVHTVAAGRHKIEVRADGYRPFSTSVVVPSGGRPVELDAQLVAEGPMQVEGVVLTQPPPADKTPSPPAEKKNKFFSHRGEPPTPRTAPAPVEAAVPSPPQPPKPVIVAVDSSARLRIVTDPPGAEVRVDGKLVGTSPVTTEPLDPGPYHPVIATLGGYAPARKAAKLEPTGTTEVKLVFEIEPAPSVQAATPVLAAGVGYLTAATKPAARLTIDGRDTGRWTPVPPANPIALPAGAHTIVFETADGRRVEEQLQIEPGKTARLIRSLP